MFYVQLLHVQLYNYNIQVTSYQTHFDDRTHKVNVHGHGFVMALI